MWFYVSVQAILSACYKDMGAREQGERNGRGIAYECISKQYYVQMQILDTGIHRISPMNPAFIPF